MAEKKVPVVQLYKDGRPVIVNASDAKEWVAKGYSDDPGKKTSASSATLGPSSTEGRIVTKEERRGR